MTGNPGVFIEVIWLDDDVLELRVQASNGRFSATAELYAAHTEPAELAASISGFPKSTDDNREATLGTFDAKVAGGGVQLRFRCTDLLGHAEVRLDVRQRVTNGPERESAAFSVRVEPAAVDEFVAALRRMRLQVGSSAELRGQP